jgi:GT2 family glycosyltransferase
MHSDLINLIVATRHSLNDFASKTATGRSIAFNKPPFLNIKIFPNNSLGLPALYNKATLEFTEQGSILVFAHDDLHLLDFFWFHRITQALTKFDIVGLAGNVRRVSRQPSWAFINDQFVWDDKKNLSGIVGHGTEFPPSNLSIFGPPGRQVKLLDGLLLAAKRETLITNNLFFDEKFDFHFYDLDFCRQAEAKGLSCGTVDISLIHESGGNFNTPAWRSAYEKYLLKWGE